MNLAIPNKFNAELTHTEMDVSNSERVYSSSISQTIHTTLGNAIRNNINLHKGHSGFKLLGKGSESFAARLALIQAAEKTIDLQYYSIHDDTTSNLLLEALVRADHRNVRVRFLIDDIDFAKVSHTFRALNSLKNIEIRVFNPITNHKHGFIHKWFTLISNLHKANHRMHNKSLVVDNQMAIMGGRNLGDEYFEEHTDVTFRDIDILAAGPIAATISTSFDEYWNNSKSVILNSIYEPETNIKNINEICRKLRDHRKKMLATENGSKLLNQKISDFLEQDYSSLILARAELVADNPEKLEMEKSEASSKPINRLNELLATAQKEFIAVSPYFVPRTKGVSILEGLIHRGVKVRVLTNSLGSTDVVAVHAGYKKYRKRLIESGVEIYEMKPIGGKRPRQRLIGKKAPARASLHAKIYIIDRSKVMIGSFNLDPRSYEINTELSIIIESTDLAEQIITMFEEVASPEVSYRVFSEGKLIWRGMDKGQFTEYNNEPKAGIIRRIESAIFSLLPFEGQL